MQKKAKDLLALLAGISLFLAACGGATPVATTATTDPNAVFTAAAQTANARITEIAASTPSAMPATATPTKPPVTPTVAATTAVATTASGTSAVPAAPTTAGGVAPVAPGSDLAQFVSDVTVPDGTNFDPGESFTKTWKLINQGKTTWTTAYKLVFVDGDAMTTTTSVPLAQEVAPGQTVDVSVNMTAPDEDGGYKGFWKLANAQGTQFDTSIYVDITVGDAEGSTDADATPSSSGDTVTDVSLDVDESSYEGSCPYTFSFTAEITLSEDAEVTYALETASEGEDEYETVEENTEDFDSGTQTLSFDLEFSDDVSGTARLHVTEPDDVTSSVVDIELSCSD